MPLLQNKKIGGFKIVIGKKTNYTYHVIAFGITVCLLGMVVYGILYASNVATRLFAGHLAPSGNMVKFNLEAARNNLRLSVVPVPEDPIVSESPVESPVATSSPVVSPTP